MMLENYSPDNYWNARYDRLGADWQPLSTALAERYGLEALLDPNDLARVRDTLGWDRQIFARALLDLLWLTLARWEPRRDGSLLLQLDLPPEQQPDVAIRIMDFWDNVLEEVTGARGSSDEQDWDILPDDDDAWDDLHEVVGPDERVGWADQQPWGVP